MKIPTLLALALLSILIIGGIIFKFFFDQNSFFKKTDPTPQQINLFNLTSNSISVSFITTQPEDAKVLYSTNQNLLTDLKIAVDDRDQNPTNRNFHFVTVQNLKENTTYYYKIKIGNNTYPENVLSFTTANLNQAFNNPNSQPLVGSVIDPNLNPVSEALVSLSLDSYLPLGTFTNAQGSFVLAFQPLVKKDNLSQILNLPTDQDAKLIITKGQLKSEVDIHLNQPSKVLPPIILGQNLDLRDYIASAEALLKQASASAQPINFDINGDGKINSADVSIVSSNLGRKKFTNPKVDLNSDGIVDQKDLNLIKQALQQP